MARVVEVEAKGERRARAIGVSLTACLVVSALGHLGIFGVALIELPRGNGGGGGEGGRGGAGGSEVEITVSGPEREPVPEAGDAPTPEEAQLPEPARDALEVPPPEAVHPRQERAARVVAPVESPDAVPVHDAVEPTPPAPAPTPAAPATPALLPGDQGSPTVASGTGSTTTNSGRAMGDPALRRLILGSAGLVPGSVAAQRALLPDAVTCSDPIAGVWRAHKFSPLQMDWALFTLQIERGPNQTLTGTITSRMWSGGPYDSSPPPCAPGEMDYTVRMTASGRAEGERITTFGASSYRVVRARCPSPFFAYNPDNFSGTIDPTRQEFQSVNNDGGRDRNAPYVFRRIRCLDQPATDTPAGETPPAAATTPGTPTPTPPAP